MGLIFLILLLAASSLLPFTRAKRFGFVLWGPVVACALMLLKQLVGPLIGVHGGGGPDAGFVGIEVGFYLAVAAPICALAVISLVIAALSFPRGAAWNGWGIGVGAATTAISVFGFLGQTVPEVTVAVVNSNGFPVPDEEVRFGRFQFGSGRPLGQRRTGRNGEVRMRVPPHEWSAWVEGEDGVTSAVGVGRSSDSFLEPNSLVMTRWWSCREWGSVQPRFSKTESSGKPRRFELRLRAANEIRSTWMSGELHRMLLEVVQEGRHASALKDMCDNLESFGEFPLLGQIAQKNEMFARLIGGVLDHQADLIDASSGCFKTANVFAGRTSSQPHTMRFAVGSI